MLLFNKEPTTTPTITPPSSLPFAFYAESIKPRYGAASYPDAAEETRIRTIFGETALRDDFVVYGTARHPRSGETPSLPSLHYSCCTLVLCRPPVTYFVLKRHIIAHSDPEDLRRAIQALLVRLGLDHWVRSTREYNVYDPADGARQGMSHSRRPSLNYDAIFGNAPPPNHNRNRGMLTTIEIHLGRSRRAMGYADAQVREALQAVTYGFYIPDPRPWPRHRHPPIIANAWDLTAPTRGT